MKSKTYKFDFPIDFSVCKSIQCKKFKIILRASDRFEYFEVDNGFSHQKSWYSFLPLYNPKLRYKKVLIILGCLVIFLISFSSFLFQFIFYFSSISPSLALQDKRSESIMSKRFDKRSQELSGMRIS